MRSAKLGNHLNKTLGLNHTKLMINNTFHHTALFMTKRNEAIVKARSLVGGRDVNKVRSEPAVPQSPTKAFLFYFILFFISFAKKTKQKQNK